MAETQHEHVLRVLARQSKDYLIWPDASAFVAEGLDHAKVERALKLLEKAGHAQYFEDVEVRPIMQPSLDDEGEQLLDDDGNVVHEPVLDEKSNPTYEDVLDEQGNPCLVQHGWAITEDGRKEHKEREEGGKDD